MWRPFSVQKVLVTWRPLCRKPATSLWSVMWVNNCQHYHLTKLLIVIPEMLRLQSLGHTNFCENRTAGYTGKVFSWIRTDGHVRRIRTNVYFSILLVFQVTKSIVSLLNYYNWKKFSIIYEEGWDTVARSLEQQADKKNMSVQHKKNARDRHKCCEQNYKCCQSGFWYDFIQNSKNKTRST